MPILKGSVEKDLLNGSADFEKVQIKEVTSHFRNGWVFFVVYAKMPSIFAKTQKNNEKNEIIEVDFMEIKPLILEQVTVKAKKMKNRGENGEKGEKGEKEKEKSLANTKRNAEEDAEEELVYSEKD